MFVIKCKEALEAVILGLPGVGHPKTDDSFLAKHRQNSRPSNDDIAGLY